MGEMVVRVVAGALLLALLALWLFGERWRLLRRSTWRFLREGGLRRLLNGSALHAYAYGRWTNQYLDVLIHRIYPRLDARGRQRWADHYHSKVLTPEHARAIITLDEDIPLRDLEQIIPYPAARDIVLKGPPDVAVYECGCRHVRANPCEPTQVCMIIGQPFVDFVLEHNPQSSRRITQDEALALLQAEHERGHVHSAWFKDVCLDRFYAICNCCKCCCGGIEAMTKYGVPLMASSGYVAQVDKALCAACGTCEEACPFEAIQVGESAIVSWEACMGCGVCVGQCPNEAISLERDERKGEPLDVRALAGLEPVVGGS
ncbi:MAG: 4Fe-4S ferredoxin [Chloroflexi bacterium]|nr:4Fe-4S ferredoxin [Chloroflexota bacterium]